MSRSFSRQQGEGNGVSGPQFIVLAPKEPSLGGLVWLLYTILSRALLYNLQFNT